LNDEPVAAVAFGLNVVSAMPSRRFSIASFGLFALPFSRSWVRRRAFAKAESALGFV
jgi:hypothetical protein